MSSPFVAIPIIAGIALLGGGVGAVVIDLFEQCQQKQEIVLIRNLSYVTGDPRSLKALVFLVGCALYAVLGGVAGFLQADLLDAYSAEAVGNETKANWPPGPPLIIYPIMIGISGAMLVLGVRLLPYDQYPKAGIALHVVAAGCFQMFSIIYCFATISVATTLFGAESAITVVRKIFSYITVTCLCLSFLFGGYVMGKSAQLYQHEKHIADDAQSTESPTSNSILTTKQVWSIRVQMAALGVIQLSTGVAVSVVTMTGAMEADSF